VRRWDIRYLRYWGVLCMGPYVYVVVFLSVAGLLTFCAVKCLDKSGLGPKGPKSTTPGNIVAVIDRDLRAPDQYIMRL
jgi:hypothetical protein